jgi:CubicO group peptidase (beta-lactamase class C family)
VELSELIAPYVTGDGPGHAVGVYRGGELVAHAAAGHAVIEHGIPIGTDTVFDIASASKQFSAACLVLLQRDGVLSLDDDIRRHLPELALRCRSPCGSACRTQAACGSVTSCVS